MPRKHALPIEPLYMSNGMTSVFIDVLVLSGSALAATNREKELIIWLAQRDQAVVGIGTVGFDLDEIPWTIDLFENDLGPGFVIIIVYRGGRYLNTEALMQWADQHQIVQRTEAGFQGYMDNWKKEDRGEFYSTFHGKTNLQLIKTELRRISLTRDFNYIDHVSCELNITYMGQNIGSYWMLFQLDGQIEDSRLNIHDLGSHIIKEGTIKIQIFKNAIKEGIELSTISRFLGIKEDYLRPLIES